MLATYAPSLPAETNCIASGHCIKGNFGDVAYLYTPALGQAIWVPAQHAAQPQPSILNRIDQELAKVMGYSFANPSLKLDQAGPQAFAGVLGTASSACTLQMGQTYGNFLSTCVQTTGDAKKDQTELNKLLGGLTHNDERFGFDVQGVDINFGSATLKPTDILNDIEVPQPADLSSNFSIDQSFLGKLVNDHDATGKLDDHGAGAVYKEYARLVRQDLLALKGIPDGDPTQCLLGDVSANGPPASPTTYFKSLPAYCTGFEGFVTAAPNTGATDYTNLGLSATGVPNVIKVGAGDLGRGLRPGHIKAYFCQDADGVSQLGTQHGYTLCGATGDGFGDYGDLYATSFAHVLKVFAKGQLSNLPSAAQDVRFFFQEYVKALLKYFTVAGQAGPVPDLSTIKLDAYDLYFDSIGAGQFESSEYVDRRFASPTQPPTDIVIEADVKNGIFDGYVFSRELYRGEKAIYTAMLENPADGVGQEDSALITNIFGSPLLKAGWTAGANGKTAYDCATTLDPDCTTFAPTDAKGNILMDDNGKPILTPYKGAIGATAATSFSLGPVGVQVKQTYANIAHAMYEVPLTLDPYDPTSGPAATPSISVLENWAPKQPGIGFPIALTGTRDKFIETSQADFSGTTIDAVIDYDCVIDPATSACAATGAIQFLAVESKSFLGDVFLCQDASTGDLLRAHMYTPVSDILQWFGNHPGSYDACGIIIRYSPYNNYADYITTLNNGVRLEVTQGGGYGRIVGSTLFVPGQ